MRAARDARPDLTIRLAHSIGGHPALQGISTLIDLRVTGHHAEGALASFEGGRSTVRRVECHDELLVAALFAFRYHERTPRVGARFDTSETWSSIAVTVGLEASQNSFAVDCLASGFEGEDATELERFLGLVHLVAGIPRGSQGYGG